MSQRWDEGYLFANLKKVESIENIQKIWVCGPPKMEEQFEIYLGRLADDLGLDFKSQVDIM